MGKSVDAIVIGAGPAGLATAAALMARGLTVAILEKSDAVGAVWRRHYDRLCLHTDRGHSGLPGLSMPSAFGRYPSRAQVVEYLENYAAKFDLKPVFNAPVRAVRRDGRGWRAEAGENSRSAPIVVVATGWADYPYAPKWPGMERFDGPILHSSVYRNPAPFEGKRVLVVGFGNSGGEIALDLAEAGVDVTLSVRGPVNIVPRDLLGLPILDLGDRPAASARASDRLHQRAGPSPRRRLDREARHDARRQGPAPDDRGGWPRAAARRRRGRPNPRRADQGSRRHRAAGSEDHRLRDIGAGAFRRRHSRHRISPGPAPAAARRQRRA